mgnify:CR=1 FL=1
MNFGEDDGRCNRSNFRNEARILFDSILFFRMPTIITAVPKRRFWLKREVSRVPMEHWDRRCASVSREGIAISDDRRDPAARNRVAARCNSLRAIELPFILPSNHCRCLSLKRNVCICRQPTLASQTRLKLWLFDRNNCLGTIKTEIKIKRTARQDWQCVKLKTAQTWFNAMLIREEFLFFYWESKKFFLKKSWLVHIIEYLRNLCH